MKYFITIGLLALSCWASAQNNVNISDRKPVQLSGLTVSDDSLDIVPFVTILVKNRFKGTISDNRGFFSFVALYGDTVVFSAVGYKPSAMVVDDEVVEDDIFSVLMPLTRDTIQLPMAVIWPWPSKEAFRAEFLALELKDDAYSRAAKNLEAELLAQLASAMTMDASENQRLYMQKTIAQTYYAGGQQNFHQMGGPNAIPIPSTLLNPLAWSEFVKAIKRGDFKRK
ncbi:MAG: hypothetical protein ACK417_08095 [Bacteroidia bacterium]